MNSSKLLSTLNKTDPVQKGVLKPRPWDFGEITLLILLIFAAIGNFLTIKVMRTKRMRNSNASLFVICMAVSDFLLLLLKFTANMIKIYRVTIYNLCILIQIIPQAASFISVWLIIITSAERTTAVLLPLQVASIFSHKRCKLIITFMILFFLFVSSTTSVCIEYFEEQPYYCKIKGDQNGTCFYYYTFVFPWIKGSFGSWIPSILGICLNMIIIVSLYKASKRRQYITSYQLSTKNKAQVKLNQENLFHKSLNNHVPIRENGDNFKLLNSNKKRTCSLEGSNMLENNNNKKKKSSSSSEISNHLLNNTQLNLSQNQNTPSYHAKERQITIMLLTISISFILFTLPYSTYELFRKLGFKYKLLKSRNFLRFVMMLIDINHATNFILYCLTAQRFRNELKIILIDFFKCKKSNNNFNKYARTSSIISTHLNLINNTNNNHNSLSIKAKSNSKLNQFN